MGRLRPATIILIRKVRRSKHLYNLTLQSMKVLRAQRPVDYSNVETKEISFLDIELPDVRGEVVKLSTVAPRQGGVDKLYGLSDGMVAGFEYGIG